jgi:Raf kinase inhibitor-like YbhB/YbcL family protein
VLARPAAALAAMLALAGLATACDKGDGRTMRPPTEAQRVAMPTTTTTTTIPGILDPTARLATTVPPTTATAAFALTLPWAEGAAIPPEFTCDGADRSPPLSWTPPPPGTVELALLVTDDNANGYVHWAVAGIPSAAGQTTEGAPIPGAVEGVNGFGKPGWGGPCPPKGAAHTYRFRLYALSQQAELPTDFTGQDLASVAENAAVTIAEGTGTYARAG